MMSGIMNSSGSGGCSACGGKSNIQRPQLAPKPKIPKRTRPMNRRQLLAAIYLARRRRKNRVMIFTK